MIAKAKLPPITTQDSLNEREGPSIKCVELSHDPIFGTIMFPESEMILNRSLILKLNLKQLGNVMSKHANACYHQRDQQTKSSTKIVNRNRQTKN